MNAEFLYKLALTLHITGFTMLAGATLSAYVSICMLWKPTANDVIGAQQFLRISSGLGRVATIGGLQLITAGATMITLIIKAGPVVPQRWFQVKMILVVLLIGNIAFVGSRQTGKLKRILIREGAETSFVKLRKTRRLLLFFYNFQLLLMLTIFVLSAFRFM